MVANGDRVRTLTIHPVLMVASLVFVLVFGLGYLGATTYLFYRDDLIGAAFARQARMQHAYEDRIAALRAEIDRISSRQLLDQEAFESKLDRLLTQQDLLKGRHSQVATVIEQARQSGIRLIATAIPVSKPSTDGDVTGSVGGGIGGEFTEQAPAKAGMLPFPSEKPLEDKSAALSDPDKRLGQLESNLLTITRSQASALDAIAVAAEADSSTIASTIQGLGVRLAHKIEGKSDAAKDDAGQNTGGPFVPLIGGDFQTRIDRAERALERYTKLREVAVSLPIRRPVRNSSVTSHYGARLDPFLGRPAMHTGIDFKGTRRTPVRATAAGKVIRAGRFGGYGRCVEIDHGKGLVTRYAHLSKIFVTKGTYVPAGHVLGRVGSTGRSTGPHLHYETRVRGKAVDPVAYLDAGKELRTFLR